MFFAFIPHHPYRMQQFDYSIGSRLLNDEPVQEQKTSYNNLLLVCMLSQRCVVPVRNFPYHSFCPNLREPVLMQANSAVTQLHKHVTAVSFFTGS